MSHDYSTMDHGMPDMDHGGNGGHDGHGGMDMGGQCSMNMLWNTQIIDTCIVFPQWHIRSHGSFVLSFFAIVALGIFYEWLRFFAKRVDRSVARLVTSNNRGKGSGSGGGKNKGVSVNSASASVQGLGRRSPSPTAAGSSSADEDVGLLTGSGSGSGSGSLARRRARKGLHLTNVPSLARTLRAVLYGAQVFLSFFLMLIFMTYNAYLILAVVLGASIGHYYLGGQIDADALLSGGADDKGMACH